MVTLQVLVKDLLATFCGKSILAAPEAAIFFAFPHFFPLSVIHAYKCTILVVLFFSSFTGAADG